MKTGSTTLPPSAPAPHAYPRLRRFAIDLAICQVFNMAIALVVTYMLRLNDSVFQNLTVSVCIGTLMVCLIDGGRLLLWGTGMPPRLPFILLFVVALPTAHFFGNQLAASMLAIPPERIAAAQSKNEIGFYVMFLFTCAAITWFFWNRSLMAQLLAQAEAEKARAAAIEKQAMQAQLQLLQAQIEPHMLFNTLANLQGLIALDAPRAQQMLDQLIHYLRATLSASRTRQVTLAEEFALMEAYLGLMKVRMGDRLSYRLQLPAELRGLTLPPMLLQPLVENAIKHGLEPKLEGGRIEVGAAARDGMLALTVLDDGLGLGADKSTAGTGIGVANIRERLQAMYGERAALSLEPAVPAGACACLRIPL